MKRKVHLLCSWLTLCVGILMISNISYADHDIRMEAHELDEAANHAYAEAYRESYGGRDNYWALNRLYDLATEAEHFHRLVESYYANPYHINEDFRRLESAFYRADEAMRRGYFSEHVWRDFYRCEEEINELRYTFGYGRDDDHGGYERPIRPIRPIRP